MTATTERLILSCPTWCVEHGKPDHDVTDPNGDPCISDYNGEGNVHLSLMPDFDYNGGIVAPQHGITGPDMRPATIGCYLFNATEGHADVVELVGNDKHTLAKLTLDEAEMFAQRLAAVVAAGRAEEARATVTA